METTLLDQILAEKREERERERREMLEKALKLVERLSGRYGFRQAVLFGSVLKEGRFCEDSDVDIAVEALPGEHFFALAAELSRTLGREVDLVELETCRFSGKIRKEGLRWIREH